MKNLNKGNLLIGLSLSLLATNNAYAGLCQPSNVPCSPMKKGELLGVKSSSEVIKINGQFTAAAATLSSEIQNIDAPAILSAFSTLNKNIIEDLLDSSKRRIDLSVKNSQLRMSLKIDEAVERMNSAYREYFNLSKEQSAEGFKNAIENIKSFSPEQVNNILSLKGDSPSLNVIQKGGDLDMNELNGAGSSEAELPCEPNSKCKRVSHQNVTSIVKSLYIQCANQKAGKKQAVTKKIIASNEKEKALKRTKKQFNNAGDKKEDKVAITEVATMSPEDITKNKIPLKKMEKTLKKLNVETKGLTKKQIKKKLVEVVAKKIKSGEIIPNGSLASSYFLVPSSAGDFYAKNINDSEASESSKKYAKYSYSSASELKNAKVYIDNIIYDSKISGDNNNNIKAKTQKLSNYRLSLAKRVATLELARNSFNKALARRIPPGLAKALLDTEENVIVKNDLLGELDGIRYTLKEEIEKAQSSPECVSDKICMEKYELMNLQMTNKLLMMLTDSASYMSQLKAAELSYKTNNIKNFSYINSLKKK